MFSERQTLIYSIDKPDGIPIDEIPTENYREFWEAETLQMNTIRIMQTCDEASIPYILKILSPRHDPKFLGGQIYDRNGRSQNYCSLWDTRNIQLYITQFNSSLVHFMQRRLGCEAQKATTLLYSNALAGTLNQLQGLFVCTVRFAL